MSLSKSRFWVTRIAVQALKYDVSKSIMITLRRGLCCATGLIGLFLFSPHCHAQDDVRISEFMAANDAPLTDEDGDFSDCIELHNAGTNVANPDGWYLTSRI